MKILFYHPLHNLNSILFNSSNYYLYYYNDINFNYISLSELLFNDKFKYINIFYNNLKFIIKTPIINDYIIEKFDNYYLFKFNKSYLYFLFNLEKFIIKKSIKLLSNWFFNFNFFYSSIINTNNDMIEIKIYNNILIHNNLSFHDIYSNFINNIFFDLSINLQLYGLWINNNIDNNINLDNNKNYDNNKNNKNNDIYIGLYIKSLSIDF